MSSVLLFGGRSLLDKPGVRENFLRIPEISSVIKKAQKQLEFISGAKIDLMSFATSEDNEFYGNTLWKDLVVQLFQVGLYKRMQKSMIKPKFIIGRSGGISAMDVCLGKQSLSDILTTFQLEMDTQKETEQSQDILVGQKLELSKMYIYNGETYEEDLGGKSTQALLEEISKDNLITQIIALGISDTAVDPSSILNIMNSIELDPLLSWFRAS